MNNIFNFGIISFRQKLKYLYQKNKIHYFFTKNSLLVLILFCLETLLLPSPVSAHLGNGPPFLRVNGKFAQTNPYYQGPVTLNIPLDLTSNVMLVNKPFTVSVDIPSLQKQTFMPPGFFNNVKFRWTYATGSNFDAGSGEYKYGNSANYIFSQPGSYLITLEGRAPQDQGFAIIDTDQVNVLPSLNYKLPKVTVFAGIPKSADKPAVFTAKATIDPSVHTVRFLWDFNNGNISSGNKIQHAFANDLKTKGIGLIFTRVVDDHGFVTDIGFNANVENNRLSFAPFSTTVGKVKTPLLMGNISQAQSFLNQIKSPQKNQSQFPWIGIIIGGALLAVIFTLIRLTRRSKSI